MSSLHEPSNPCWRRPNQSRPHNRHSQSPIQPIITHERVTVSQEIAFGYFLRRRSLNTQHPRTTDRSWDRVSPLFTSGHSQTHAIKPLQPQIPETAIRVTSLSDFSTIRNKISLSEKLSIFCKWHGLRLCLSDAQRTLMISKAAQSI